MTSTRSFLQMGNIYFFILFITFISCGPDKEQQYRSYIDLSGKWQFALDTTGVGEEEKWYLTDLNDVVELPGTTDLNQKGFLNKDTTTMHLNRIYKYEGPAWYRKNVVIPESVEEKHLQLFFERSKFSKVWVDSSYVGDSKLLQSPQKFDVTRYLTPGKHTITVLVNNDLKLTPYGNVHVYSDDTQTNWNGILGDMYIEAMEPTHIAGLQVYPDVDNRKAVVEMQVEDQFGVEQVDIELLVRKTENGETIQLEPQKFIENTGEKIRLEYSLDENTSLWDEYAQSLYTLTAIISYDEVKDSKTVPFGMREFAVDGTQFSINGRKTFLRGKHEAAVFPLTGYPPMEVEEWVRVYRIAKSYGINHYRFHSYCPPEAAFIAADQEGIYLQAELPFWGGLEADSTAEVLRQEGYKMLMAYANHPSFVMFSHGNEIWSGHDRIEDNIVALKAFDSRPLYTMGCNNNIGYVAPRECSDFFVGARTPSAGDTTLTHTRLTHAFADSRSGGILNTQVPSTQVTFAHSVSQLDLPIISHEIGQYQIYPDYNEIEKYTGVLRASNLEVFRDRLEEKGMVEMDSIFQQASGAWSAICYKAEMEAALRTDGMAGYQLLDLQDFPGQGTALVGVLDAFMDSKNVITPEEWRQSCNDIVLLAEFAKYCWTSGKSFQANIRVANYSDKVLKASLVWEITREDGSLLRKGAFEIGEVRNGGLSDIGAIEFDLTKVKGAEMLTLKISLPETDYTNAYPIWVYPPAQNVETGEVIISEELDEQTVNQLKNGARILLFPQTDDVKNKSFAGHFPPEFWNYGMFKGISEWADKPVSPGTLGLLMNPEHPLFDAFPTDFHTNWQWFSIIKKSNSLILDEAPDGYQPIVQVIDNLERNHKLGMIFEFKVGEGKLLVCMSQLPKLTDRPEAMQLYRSILNYMDSDSFDPQVEVSERELKALL